MPWVWARDRAPLVECPTLVSLFWERWEDWDVPPSVLCAFQLRSEKGECRVCFLSQLPPAPLFLLERMLQASGKTRVGEDSEVVCILR